MMNRVACGVDGPSTHQVKKAYKNIDNDWWTDAVLEGIETTDNTGSKRQNTAASKQDVGTIFLSQLKYIRQYLWLKLSKIIIINNNYQLPQQIKNNLTWKTLLQFVL